MKLPQSWSDENIAAKELVPIVVAAASWGPSWYHKGVLFRTDNMAVVDVLRSRTSHDPLIMHLLRCLVLYACLYHFDFTAKHLPGVHNVAANALSRDNLPLFLSSFPQTKHTPISQSILELLVRVRPDWGSPEWTAWFRNSLTKEFQGPPGQCTSQAGIGTSTSVPPLANPHYPLPNTPSADLLQ